MSRQRRRWASVSAAVIVAAAAVIVVLVAGRSTVLRIPTGPPPLRSDPQVRADYLAPPGAHEVRPKVSLGAANAPSMLSGGRLVAANAVGGAPFRYSGIAQMKPGPSVYGAYRFPAGSRTARLSTGLPYRVEFVADADQLEVATLGNGTVIHIRMDGYVVARLKLPLDGSRRLVRLVWRPAGPERRHRILLECSNGTAFGGVRVPRGQRIAPPREPAGPRMIVVGDSWTDGAGSDGVNDHAYVAGQLLGIRDTWVAGVGGTGYLQDGSQGRHIGARIRSDIIDHHPDVVIFCYGSDDIRFSPQQIASAASGDWRRVRAALPDARVIVEGPWPAAGANARAAASDAAIDAALQRAARAAGLPYVSPVQDAWIQGTGYVGHRSGTGNSNVLIGPDGIHPSPSGHLYVGNREAAAWRALLGVHP
jgi:lysophospholipase L1-like esterase